MALISSLNNRIGTEYNKILLILFKKFRVGEYPKLLHVLLCKDDAIAIPTCIAFFVLDGY